MGKGTYTRRELFQNISGTNSPTQKIPDKIFKQYAKKKKVNRHYSEDVISYEEQQEIADGAANRVGNVTSGLSPYTGTWGRSEILHLLRRTSFGYKKTHYDALALLSMSNAVDAITSYTTTPSPATPVNYYQPAFPDPNTNILLGSDWTGAFYPNYTNTNNSTCDAYRIVSLRSWSVGLMLNADNNIREKMTWFLYHFIPIDFGAIRNAPFSYSSLNGSIMCYRFMKLLRDNSLGNFKNFIMQLGKEPAMMYYLNNQANSATAPDENYARELMELFTLGKDPASQYTQPDVVAAAKVLSGWRVQNANASTMATNFVSGSHATGTKTFSSFFNNANIPAPPNTVGANEYNELVNLIFSKDVVVSEYICRRLYRYFVYYDIDANVEANVIVPLAQTFRNNNWELLPVIKQLLKSEHFYDMANRGCYIKSPFDLVMGILNSFSVDSSFTAPADIDQQYKVWENINNRCNILEQYAGDIPNVSGWNAFYQQPAFHQNWINSNTIQQREKFITDIFNGYNVTTRVQTTPPNLLKLLKVDVLLYAQQFGNPIARDPNLLIQSCIDYLLPVDLGTATKSQIKLSTLLSGQSTDSYWTTAWDNYVANPTNATNLNLVTTRVRSMLVSIVKSAEYQLM